MTIYTWSNFSKRKNSTKQPAIAGTSVDVYLKENCSLEHPVFIISGIDLSVNYVQWGSHYYFVDDIIITTADIYELHCSMDVLATFKSDIGDYTAYIERSASNYDDLINDPLITATQDIGDLSRVAVGYPFGSAATGCYIVEVMNTDGIQLYACDSLDPWKVIFQPSTYSAQNVVDWIDSKIAQAFDLDVYIGTVKWVPFTASTLGGTATYQVKIGPITATSSTPMYLIDQAWTYSQQLSITLPTPYYTDFRECNPRYTQFFIFLPGCGTMQLDSAILGTATLYSRTVRVDCKVDLVSGDIAYRFDYADANGNMTPLETYRGNISVNVPIGKSVSDIAQSISGMVSTTGSMAGAGTVAGGMAGGAAGAIAGAAVGAIGVIDNILTPRVTMAGGMGNKASLLAHNQIYLSVVNYGSKAVLTNVAGRPLCEFQKINTLTGFVKCGAPSVDIPGMGGEKDAVNGFLASGFYYE